MFTILIVCTGNTCRSPMAHGILQKMLTDNGYDNVNVVSAGIGTLNGYPATNNAVLAAKEMDVDISNHHSTRVTKKVVENADLILTLADGHYDYLQQYSEIVEKLYMLKAFPKEGCADFVHSVKDPIGGTLDEYRKTIREIERELIRALPDIKKWIERKQNVSK